jgi:hypothetical protein
MGTDAIGRIYSGSVSGSTGLTSLIGNASGRFRYNSDESTTNYTTALTAGLNAIYREAISVTVTTDTKTVTYGDSISLTGTTSGLVNGDTASYTISNEAYSTSNNLKADSYTVVGGGPLGLGYSVSATNGTLTVDKKAITISGFAVSDKDYDGLRTATVTNSGSVSGQVTNDLVSVSSVSAVFRIAERVAKVCKCRTPGCWRISTSAESFRRIGSSSAMLTRKGSICCTRTCPQKL